MDVTASLIKLKPNSLARVDEWAETINRRQAEALATLKDEGVELESWFYVQVEGSDYLLCFMGQVSAFEGHLCVSIRGSLMVKKTFTKRHL